MITKILTSTAKHRLSVNGLQATKLSSRNVDVEEINLNSLQSLQGLSGLTIVKLK